MVGIVVGVGVDAGVVIVFLVVARVEGRLVVKFVSGLAVQRGEEGAAWRVLLASDRAILISNAVGNVLAMVEFEI